MKDLFDFNHIDPAMDKETKKELEKLYKYYHKLWWCHKNSLPRNSFPQSPSPLI